MGHTRCAHGRAGAVVRCRDDATRASCAAACAHLHVQLQRDARRRSSGPAGTGLTAWVCCSPR
eukprot:449626-Prymnesium_polylepis.1